MTCNLVRWSCALFASIALAACAPEQAPETASDPAATLAAEFGALVEGRELPGAIAIVKADGRLLAKSVTGWQDIETAEPLSEDSIFRIYSMSKPITSVATMVLVERGALTLDDPIETFLPEFADVEVYVSGDVDEMATEPAGRSITVRDLLTHMSGIAYHFTGNTPVHQYYRKHGVMRDTPVGRTPEDGPPARSLDELVQRIGDAPLLYHPGETFEYSYSTTVLGAVLERASGQRLDAFLQDAIFVPLGMTDTGFFISDDDLPRFTTLYTATPDGLAVAEAPATSDYRDLDRLLDGGGALASTADDYLRFAEMLANGGELDGRRVLSEASVDALFEPHVSVQGLGPQSMRFGLGFAVGDADSDAAGMQPDGTAGWSGSGNTYFFVDREQRAVALLMTHVLVGGQEADRTATFRSTLNKAAAELLDRR